MTESEITAQHDLMEVSSEKQFDILNPNDYQHTMGELSKNQNLFDLMRTGFQLRYDVTRGLQFNELQELIQSEHGERARFMLGEVQKLTEGQSTWLATTSVDSTKRDTILVFGKFINGKYDILNVQATQIKTFDEQKLIAYVVGAICAGVVFSKIPMSLDGVCAIGSILVASGAKAIYDYRNALPDLIYGYIIKKLVDESVINVENDCYDI